MSRHQQQKRRASNDPAPAAQAALPDRAFGPEADQQTPEAQAQPEQSPSGAGHTIAAAPSRPGRGHTLQPRLALGAPNDPAEQEADRVAERVLRGQSPPRIRRAAEPGAGSDLAPAVADGIARLRGGQPLDQDIRTTMEARMGHDFGQVRLHTDAQAGDLARQIQARAFTVGTDVAFAPGQYRPESATGRRLLAHELAHVVQQSATVVRRDDKTDGATSTTAPPPSEKLLVRGSTGDEVKEAQELLNKHGADPALEVDGIFGPLTQAATKAFQLRRNLVPDGKIGPFTWKALRSTPLAAGEQTAFDKVSGGGVSAADTPAELELPESVTRGMDKAWDKSFPGGKSQEQGGVIAKNKDGSYDWKAGSPGTSGSFSPNYGDVGSDETLVGSGHTHPYDKSEGGHTNVSFSGQDIARLVYVTDPVSVMQSGDTMFTILRTKDFDERVKKLDDAGKKTLFDEIKKKWDDTFKATKGELPEKAEAATKATCAAYSLSYYSGKKGGALKKQ